MDINAEIAEKVMGWSVDRSTRMYTDPKNETSGFLERVPDFLLREHGLLVATMRARGYELTTNENPPEPGKRGKTFTASFSRERETFCTTQSDERLAVCVAALKAHGLQVANDD